MGAVPATFLTTANITCKANIKPRQMSSEHKSAQLDGEIQVAAWVADQKCEQRTCLRKIDNHEQLLSGHALMVMKLTDINTL